MGNTTVAEDTSRAGGQREAIANLIAQKKARESQLKTVDSTIVFDFDAFIAKITPKSRTSMKDSKGNTIDMDSLLAGLRAELGPKPRQSDSTATLHNASKTLRNTSDPDEVFNLGLTIVVLSLVLISALLIIRTIKLKSGRTTKSRKMKVFKKSTHLHLDEMDAEMIHQYLIRNVEREDAILIIRNQIASKGEREKQLSNELQERGISLQRSIEIAQEKKNALDCIERFKQVSDMLMADQQKDPCKDKPNVPVGASQESLIVDNIATVDIQNSPIEESHAAVLIETKPETFMQETQDESRKKLSGWGSFFQIAIGLGVLGTVVNLISGLSLAGGLLPGWMLGLEAAALISFAILGIKTLISVEARSSNAIFLAKSYTALFAFNYIVGALSGTIEPSKAIGASIVSGAWFAYWTFSKNIAEVFPPERRSTSLIVKLAIAVIGLLIVADHASIGWYIKSVLQ